MISETLPCHTTNSEVPIFKTGRVETRPFKIAMITGYMKQWKETGNTFTHTNPLATNLSRQWRKDVLGYVIQVLYWSDI